MRLKRRSSSSSSRRASSSSRRGGRGRGRGGKAGKCVKCAYRRRNSPPAASTPLRAGSASSMKNKMRGPLRVFWGL